METIYKKATGTSVTFESVDVDPKYFSNTEEFLSPKTAKELSFLSFKKRGLYNVRYDFVSSSWISNYPKLIANLGIINDPINKHSNGETENVVWCIGDIPVGGTSVPANAITLCRMGTKTTDGWQKIATVHFKRR